MQKIRHFIISIFYYFMFDLKVLQSNWPRLFQHISQEINFSQVWNLCRNTENKINFMVYRRVLGPPKESGPPGLRKDQALPNNFSTYELIISSELTELVHTVNKNNILNVNFSNVLLTWHVFK